MMRKSFAAFTGFFKTTVFQLIFVIAAPVLLLLFNKNSLAFLAFLFSLYLLYRIKADIKIKLAIGLLDLLLVVPMMGAGNGYYQDVVTQIVIYATLAIGLNIVVGFAGLLNLGYVAFYAVGAYTYAIFASTQANNFLSGTGLVFPVSGDMFWLFLLFGLLVSGAVGFLLGLPVLRLKGDYLAIVTLGFAEIIRILFNNMNTPINITNGPQGITPIAPPSIFGYTLNSPVHFYFIVLGLFGLTILAISRVNNSRIGRSWAAIREDELAAKTMGIPVVRMKLLAFSMGAALAGMMGVVFAAKQTFIDPSSFGFMESIGILSMVIMGGMGNISGVIVGALAVVALQLNILKEFSGFLGQLNASGIINIPSQLDPAKYERLIFGLILILMCIFRPQGFLPAKRSLKYLKKMIARIKTGKNGDDAVAQ